MGTTELFRSFDRRITASKIEWEAAVSRLVQCAAALDAHYHTVGQVGDHVTIIGSVAKGTVLSPINDVDGVFHMPGGTHARFDRYAGNGQSALLQEVREVLRRRYPRTTIRGDGPVVVVEFTSGPNVEIVPGVLFSAGADILHAECQVPTTRDGGSWEDADYGSEYDNALSLGIETKDQSMRLVRYMKAWRGAWRPSIRSVVLDCMIAEFMSTWDSDQTSHTYDDWLVRDFLGHMVAHYYSTYALPSGKLIDTGVGWIASAKESHAIAVAACSVDDSSLAYVRRWQRVLGHGFAS